MGDSSNIEWTDKTWNPWHGCRHVSEGCRFCYMFREKRRYGQEPTNVVRSKTVFNDPLNWNEPANVFTCSWSDWFIKEADDWRPEAWSIIRRTPHLTYQILTKRIERALDHLPDDWGDGYPNVWLGVSAEDQETADERIPRLLDVPAAIRFLSAEPLLGPIDLYGLLNLWKCSACGATDNWHPADSQAFEFCADDTVNSISRLDWVIAGGESGSKDEKVRPSHPDWFRSLRDQCVAAGVPFFFKQWGEWDGNLNVVRDCQDPCGSCVFALRSWNGKQWRGSELTGTDWDPMAVPAGALQIHRIGKKAAGRLLDGREWNELPKARATAA